MSNLKDIAALISAIAWPAIAVIAGVILLAKTNLLAFLNALYDGYSEKIRDSEKLPTPWGPIEAPKKVVDDLIAKDKMVSVETSDYAHSGRLNKSELLEKFVEGELLLRVREYPSFNHEAGLIKGRYSVRLFFEFADEVKGVRQTPHRAAFSRDNIAAVHYLLHETFKQRLLTSASRDNGFEAWLRIDAEFTVVAVLEHIDGSFIAMTRYLNFPK
jgi:hypothetical protein